LGGENWKVSRVERAGERKKEYQGRRTGSELCERLGDRYRVRGC